MSDVTADEGSRLVEGWSAQTADTIKRSVTFNLDDVEWMQVHSAADGHDTGNYPDTLVGQVDFHEFYEHGMWTAFVDAGAFNVLGVKLAPNFTIPRHHHGLHQLVIVHEGEVWQGSKRFVPGDVYFTRANHAYSVTAGPEGSTVFEIRAEPITQLTTVWDERDPAKWVHGRRPGGPSAALADD
jgi:quercetin dioxygenase-like cupin family protein